MVKRKIFAPLFLAVALLIIYVPILILVVYSFTDSAFVGQWNGFSFALYARLFQEAEIMAIVKNTLLLAISAAAISTVVGTVGAIGIFYSKSGCNTRARLEHSAHHTEIVTEFRLCFCLHVFRRKVAVFAFGSHEVINNPLWWFRLFPNSSK